MKNYFKIIGNIYRKTFWSLEKQARYAGVKLGKGNFINSHFWSSEGYLITVGNNCQITSNARFFTHGGGNAVRKSHPTFDCFGKVVLGDFPIPVFSLNCASKGAADLRFNNIWS